MILHSLRLRLLLMFMSTAIVSLLIAQAFSVQTTVKAFDIYAGQLQYPPSKGQSIYIGGLTRNTKMLAITLLNTYNKQRDPQAMQSLLEQVGNDYQVHVILIDHNQQVIADSSGLLKGKSLANSADTSSIADPVMIISTDMLATSMAQQKLVSLASTPEERFFTAQRDVFWLTILIAGIVALLLSWMCSKMILKPIKTLTQVAHQMERGDLDRRVNIRTKTEIGVLARAFNTMAESLQRQEQLRRNLVSDIAHELRTPLTNIRGYLEALQDRVIEPSPETLSSLYEESLLLTRLVADLQDLSLAEAGQLCLLFKPTAIDEMISKALSALQPLATSKRISFYVVIPPYLPSVDADPERVGQILRNLLNNAIRHTPQGGEITVSARVVRGEVFVSVQDTGEGIPARHLPYIFERFYRADASRSRATGGTGLGLAIVKQMVKAHGGHVEVESTPGQGARFTFTLPVATKNASGGCTGHLCS